MILTQISRRLIVFYSFIFIVLTLIRKKTNFRVGSYLRPYHWPSRQSARTWWEKVRWGYIGSKKALPGCRRCALYHWGRCSKRHIEVMYQCPHTLLRYFGMLGGRSLTTLLPKQMGVNVKCQILLLTSYHACKKKVSNYAKTVETYLAMTNVLLLATIHCYF